MKITDLLADKKKHWTNLKKSYELLQKHSPLWLIKINNKEVLSELIKWLSTLPAWFIVETNLLDSDFDFKNIKIVESVKNDTLAGFDFVLCDSDLDNSNVYFEKWITPLIIKENHLSSILSEFNPLKSEGNAFFYDSMDKWSIFYTIVRYMENFKFPYDNRNLVKNVLDI